LTTGNNSSTTCKVCANETKILFKTTVLNKYNVQYFKCINCGFIQTEEPYWLEEAYSSAIALLDIGVVSRNLEFSSLSENLIINHFNPHAKFIDYGGGYGLFVRLMRDKGFDFYRQDSFCENIFAEYFDCTDLAENTEFELLTTFEVFEHLKKPHSDIKKMFGYSNSILFSTVLVPSEAISSPDDWWYFVPETGQHIAFYTLASLGVIAQKNNCYLYSNKKNLHLLSQKKINGDPFSEKNTNSFAHKVLQKLSTWNNSSANKIKLKSLLESDFEYIKERILNGK